MDVDLRSRVEIRGLNRTWFVIRTSLVVTHSMKSTMTSTKMAATAHRLSDREVEELIVLFQNETPLYDSSSVSYSNALSESMGGLDIGK